MNPSMCGENEVTLPDTDCSCEDFLERVQDLEGRADSAEDRLDTLERCCDDVQGTLTEHGQDITSIGNSITQINNEIIEANEKIASLSGLQTVKVNTLPSVGEPNTIYLVETQGNTVMWMYIDGQWESVGDTSVDLSAYATTMYVDTELQKKSNNPAVGEVVITSTNDVPQYPGAWNLIYKEFKTKTIIDEQVTWTRNAEGLGSVIMRKGTNIYLRLTWSSNVEFQGDDSLDVCTISFDTLGVTNMYNNYTEGHSDGDNAIGMFSITADTTHNLIKVTKTDSVSHGNVWSGNTWALEMPLLFAVSQMKDSECNRFYWERIA